MTAHTVPTDQPDALGERVRHLRCSNPSPMTLTGTNTYVVQQSDRVAIVDPGPTSQESGPEHFDAVVDAVDAAVQRIQPGDNAVGGHGGDDRPGQRDGHSGEVPVEVLLTHHHPDHCAGVDELVSRLRQAGHPVDVFGAGAGRDWPADGQLGEMRVHPAPGHTADSVVFLLSDASASVLFTGDTVLGGSSSFVAHPDGNLTDYLETLDALDQLTAGTATVLAPGHGVVGGDASDAVAHYRQHRMDRLDQVRDALAQVGADASVTQVADVVYTDVAPALRPAVEAIVSAQLEHLRRAES